MSSTRTIVTKQQVVAALAEQRVNRPRDLADANIRSLLRQFGNATNISDLKSEFYEAVYRAAGGFICSADEFFGVVSDVQPAPTAHKRAVEKPAPASPSRIRSPLVAELEARLAAAQAKTKRSSPTARVSYGNPGEVSDQADDVVRDFPAGERIR